MRNLFAELKRRNLFRVAGIYVVVGWILLQVAAALENAIGLPEWFDGFVVAFLIIGFPVAMLLTWAFELTPDGLRREKDISRDGDTSTNSRRLDIATLVVLVIAIGLFVADRFIWQTDGESQTPQ